MREPTNCAGISQRVVDCSSCSSINTATNLAMEDGADQNDSDCVIQSDAESDSDSEDREFGTPPKEKRPRAMCGAAVYGTKYNCDWESNFPFISRGKHDKTYSFYCKVCHKDVSCRHQGISDVKRHEKSSNHVTSVKSLEGSSRLDSMGFVPLRSAISTQVRCTYSYCIIITLVFTDKASRSENSCFHSSS